MDTPPQSSSSPLRGHWQRPVVNINSFHATPSHFTNLHTCYRKTSVNAMSPYIAKKRVANLLRIQEVRNQHFGTQQAIVTEGFRAGTLPGTQLIRHIKPRPLPSTSVHCSLKRRHLTPNSVSVCAVKHK